MSESKKLTSKDITMLGIRSSFLQASFNYERIYGIGVMITGIEKNLWR